MIWLKRQSPRTRDIVCKAGDFYLYHTCFLVLYLYLFLTELFKFSKIQHYMGKFTSSNLHFWFFWPSRAHQASPESSRALFLCTGTPETLLYVIWEFGHSILNGFQVAAILKYQVICSSREPYLKIINASSNSSSGK